MARAELFNAVTAFAGLTPGCPAVDYSYDVPDASTCVDAPSFGKFNGTALTCSVVANRVAKAYSISIGQLCDGFFERATLAYLRDTWAPSVYVTYEPPAGYDPQTLAVELCKGVCMGENTGPCWLRGPFKQWCAAASAPNTEGLNLTRKSKLNQVPHRAYKRTNPKLLANGAFGVGSPPPRLLDSLPLAT